MHAAERDQPDIQAKRAAFQAQLAALDPEQLVFVDESGVLTSMVRLYARAPEGQKAQGSAPAGRWQRLTALGTQSPHLLQQSACEDRDLAGHVRSDVVDPSFQQWRDAEDVVVYIGRRGTIIPQGQLTRVGRPLCEGCSEIAVDDLPMLGRCARWCWTRRGTEIASILLRDDAEGAIGKYRSHFAPAFVET